MPKCLSCYVKSSYFGTDSWQNSIDGFRKETLSGLWLYTTKLPFSHTQIHVRKHKVGGVQFSLLHSLYAVLNAGHQKNFLCTKRCIMGTNKKQQAYIFREILSKGFFFKEAEISIIAMLEKCLSTMFVDRSFSTSRLFQLLCICNALYPKIYQNC